MTRQSESCSGLKTALLRMALRNSLFLKEFILKKSEMSLKGEFSVAKCQDIKYLKEDVTPGKQMRHSGRAGRY